MSKHIVRPTRQISTTQISTSALLPPTKTKKVVRKVKRSDNIDGTFVFQTADQLHLQSKWKFGYTDTTSQTWNPVEVFAFDTVGEFWGMMNYTVMLPTYDPTTDTAAEIWFFKQPTFPDWDIVKEIIGSTFLCELGFRVRGDNLKETVVNVILMAVGATIPSEEYLQGIRIKSGGDFRFWVTNEAAVDPIQTHITDMFNRYGFTVNMRKNMV
jgi:hypothetical protein